MLLHLIVCLIFRSLQIRVVFDCLVIPSPIMGIE